jgi:hypothetical protein
VNLLIASVLARVLAASFPLLANRTVCEPAGGGALRGGGDGHLFSHLQLIEISLARRSELIHVFLVLLVVGERIAHFSNVRLLSDLLETRYFRARF